MADPLSITSGLLAIVTATIQSSKALYETIQSFRDHPREVRQLRGEIEALNGVLVSLQALARHDESLCHPLQLPLHQCYEACTEFQSLIARYTKHSGQSGTSFRDWAKLRYMDSDIVGFTSMLAGYKATIAIALADANLSDSLSLGGFSADASVRRTSTVTLNVLNEYKEMIRNTSHDLEDRLKEIDAKLGTVLPPSSARSTVAATHIQRFRDERDSTEKCLEICTQVLARIEELRLQPLLSDDRRIEDASTGLSPRDLSRAHIMTLSTLKECSDKLNDTLAHLSAHREDASTRLQAGSAPQQSGVIGNDTNRKAQRLASELDSARQCLVICSDASQRASSGKIHVLEDITVGNDGQQMLISTLGELFDAKRVTVGDRATQVVGLVSDASLQEIFRARSQM